MYAPTRTLLHTYNRHDHHHHDHDHDHHDHDHDHHHHHHHHHHHIITDTMIIIALTFATPLEQYVDWSTNINYISMRDQSSPPPIFMRDQNLPPPMNNMLIGVITSTLSSYPPEVRRGATSGLQRTCNNMADGIMLVPKVSSLIFKHAAWVVRYATMPRKRLKGLMFYSPFVPWATIYIYIYCIYIAYMTPKDVRI